MTVPFSRFRPAVTLHKIQLRVFEKLFILLFNAIVQANYSILTATTCLFINWCPGQEEELARCGGNMVEKNEKDKICCVKTQPATEVFSNGIV